MMKHFTSYLSPYLSLLIIFLIASSTCIRSLVWGLELTNHKFAGDFISRDIFDDGYADVVFVPSDFR